jgi:cell division transport system permease protein
MRFRLVVSESLRSLTANLSTTVAATMTVLIGMFLVGICVALGTWMISWSNHVKKEVIVKVYLARTATPADINRIGGVLNSNDLVKPGGVKFVSRDEALKRMEKRYPDLVKNIPGNPLPPAFEVTPKRAEYADDIDRSLQPRPAAVAQVKYGRKTARKIISVAAVIEAVVAGAVLILLGASTLLIANTIRLSIFARRREIEVMKLVGATNWFVRGPFMLEGLLCGLLGSIAAIVLLFIGKELAMNRIFGHFETSSDIRAIAFWLNGSILLLLGLLLGAAGSGLTLRRFLRV